jgi:hypothetical protein
MRESPTLAKYQSVEELAKGHIYTSAMVGADKVVLPGENATEEQIAEFHKKLGRPDTHEAYEFEPVRLPEGFKPDDAIVEGLREAAHAAGLNQKQFNGVWKWLMGRVTSGYEQGVQMTQQAVESAKDELVREWGAGFNDRFAKAERAANAFFGTVPGGAEFLEQTGLGRNPTFIKVMANIGEQISPDSVVGGGGAPSFGAETPADAEAKIGAIMAGEGDLGKAYMDDESPRHQSAVDEVERLSAIAYRAEGE